MNLKRVAVGLSLTTLITGFTWYLVCVIPENDGDSQPRPILTVYENIPPRPMIFRPKDETTPAAGKNVSTTGPNFPGTVTNDSSFGFVAWNNPGNASADDSSDATVINSDSDSNYLKATNFGFSIPATDVIDGIAVTVNRKCTGGCSDRSIKLVQGGTIGGTDLSAAAVWTTSYASNTVGGPTELWGRTWTYSDINSSTFGVAFAAVMSDVTETASVDYITITVYHHASLPDAAVPICNALEQDEQSMIFLRKSTNSQEVPLGFFLDETDGATTLTALTIAASDIKLFKAGATSEVNKNSGGATHLADGRYYAVFNSTDTDTAGSMTIHIHVSGALPRTIYCTVLDANMYDWWTGNTAPGSGTALDAAGVRSAVGLASANLDTQLSTLTGYVDTEVAAIKAKTDNLPSDPADASVVAGLIAAVEAKVDTVDTVVDTILTKVDTEIADIQSRLPATLISGRMDSHVGAMGSNTLTAAALATDAVTEIQSGLATADDVTDSDVVLCRYGGAFTSSAGTEFRASAWLERNGQIVVLASGTCTLTFRENASGSDLFTVTDSAPNAQGIFEIVKTSPGFTSDRLQIATVEIDDGVNPAWVTRYPVPIR